MAQVREIGRPHYREHLAAGDQREAGWLDWEKVTQETQRLFLFGVLLVSLSPCPLAPQTGVSPCTSLQFLFMGKAAS